MTFAFDLMEKMQTRFSIIFIFISRNCNMNTLIEFSCCCCLKVSLMLLIAWIFGFQTF